jgi:hypothetical protein
MSDSNQTDRERLKNDGTDPKKDDPANPVASTDRSCYIQIVNSIGQTITNVSFTHSSGNTNDVINAASMDPGDSTPKKQISYETGFNADFDYWNISFTMNGYTYDTPYNDRCNISYEDAGRTVQGIIQKDGVYGGDHNLEISMPVSSNCNFNIDKKP